MSALIREAAIGQIIRYVTRNKFFKYPEEEPGFVVPEVYANPDSLLEKQKTIPEESGSNSFTETPLPTPGGERPDPINDDNIEDSNVDLEKAETQLEPIHAGGRPHPHHMRTATHTDTNAQSLSIRRTKTREETLPWTNDRVEAERVATLDRTATRPIVPAVTNNGDILVDWYTTDDDSNPQNWSLKKKNFATLILWYVLALSIQQVLRKQS